MNRKQLIEALTESHVFQDYEKAFTELTGMPVTLRTVESWHLPHHNRRNENPFCSLMAQKSRSCAACLQVMQELSEKATTEAQCVTCPTGLCDMAIPVRNGEEVVGFLQTGQIFRRKPTAAQFDRVAKLVAEWGVQTEVETLREAYFSGKILSQKEIDATCSLLTIFAKHLSLISNQIMMQNDNAEPPVITRARQYIQEHQTEDLSLGQVAKAVNTSTFYFCKMFKKVTGINFTDYISRLRIERAKNLLLNPNLRVSEIAFEVGFQSLTHFNRVFKKVVGQSPSEFRQQLQAA
ncbi:MAG TPA: helix-turn-helix domain-containing protein [Roseimicrobium sp.]|nr:helix-turn-helix domain-containing protein [Roseimicrobium sp.]